MLRTNSKQAKENLKNYIMEHFDFTGYEEEGKKAPETYKEICRCIYDTMQAEKYCARARNDYETFKDWCQGLPSLLDTCYYYNRSAVEDLKNILEETTAEAERFTEEQAAERLTYLMFREITKNM